LVIDRKSSGSRLSSHSRTEAFVADQIRHLLGRRHGLVAQEALLKGKEVLCFHRHIEPHVRGGQYPGPTCGAMRPAGLNEVRAVVNQPARKCTRHSLQDELASQAGLRRSLAEVAVLTVDCPQADLLGSLTCKKWRGLR